MGLTLAGFPQHHLLLPKTAMSSLCPCSVLPTACLGSRHWLVLPWLQGTVGAGWSLLSSTLTLQTEPCLVFLAKGNPFPTSTPPAAFLPFQGVTGETCVG